MFNSKRTILQDLRFRKRGSKPIQKCGRDKEMLVITGIFVISGSLSIIIPCRPGAKDVIRYTRVC